ncbi:MAG: hypothetical protein AAFY34_16280 [Pseudomonadota bacterium]
MRFVIAIGLLISSALPAAAQWPEPLNSALTRSPNGPNYVFDVERTSTDTDDDGETLRAYARVDPNAEDLKQITPAHLVDNSLPGSSFRALAGIESALEDGIWCTRFAEDVPRDPDDIEIVSEDENTITYAFTPPVAEDAEGPEKKITRRTRAEITVSKTNPAVLNYARELTRTVTIFVVAKIRKADSEVTCTRAPDGRTYTSYFQSEFQASGIGDGGNASEMRITAIYDPETGELLAPES